MSSRVLRFTPEQHADYERRRAQAIGIAAIVLFVTAFAVMWADERRS